MKPKYPQYTRRYLAVAGAFLLAAHITYAADATWNGTNNATWADAGNWSASPVPGTGNTATFNNAGNSNVVLDLGGGVTLKSIVFDTASAAAYTIGTSGTQVLTLDATALITNNSNTVNNQLVNAAIVLGTASADEAFTFTNNKIGTALTFAGGISNGTNTGIKTLTVNGTSNTLITGNITDGSGGTVALTKAGTGTLGLTGTNSYTGVTTVSTGALSYLKTSAKSSGAINVSGGATLGLGLTGTGAFTSTDVNALFGNTLAGVAMTSNSNVGIDTSLGDLSYSTNMPSSTMGLAKLGNNKLSLSGTHAYLGNTTVFQGTLEITGGSITSNGNFYGAIDSSKPTTLMSGGSITLTAVGGGGNRVTVGQNNGGNPSSMVMSNDATLTTAGNFSVGGNAGGTAGSGEFAMKDNAILNVQSTSTLGFYVQGDGSSGTAHMLLRDNAKVNASRITVSSNFGTLTQTGGEVNIDNNGAAAGNFNRISNGAGRQAWYNMTGGSFNVAGTVASILSVGTNRGFGHMNITGTAQVNLPANVDFRLCSNQSGTLGYFGEVNLAGGTLSTAKVSSPDIGGDVYGGVFNFNGGVLKAIRDEPDFMQNLRAVNNPTPGAAYIYPGGAVIDTNTFNIAIGQPMLEPVGQGVTSISFNPGTKTYVAPPRVSFASPPGNLPAQTEAFATLNDSGQINGIILTKPGFGYTSIPAVSFDIGDATATCTLGNINGGGLTKNGLGTLTLKGKNTYTGDTVVNAGTLELMATWGGLKFKIGDNHVSNKITGTGAVQLDGEFTIDLSGANKTKGNTWTLVDVASLTEGYGATFTIAPQLEPTGDLYWTQTGDEWTLPDGDTGNIWKFKQSTGVLSYVSPLTPYETWATNYPGADLTDPAADYDSDGLSNQQEFAFGQDPTKGSSANPISSILTTGGQFSYKRTVDSGLTYSVWTSEDLATWTEDTGAIQTPGAIVGTTQTYSVQLSATPSGTKFFVKVKATE